MATASVPLTYFWVREEVLALSSYIHASALYYSPIHQVYISPFASTPALPDSFLNVPLHFFGICHHCANCALRGWSLVGGEPQSLDTKTLSCHAKLLMSYSY